MFKDVWQDTKLGVGQWREAKDVYSAFTLARESEVALKAAQEANRNLRARIAQLITELGGDTGTEEK